MKYLSSTRDDAVRVSASTVAFHTRYVLMWEVSTMHYMYQTILPQGLQNGL